MRKFRTIAVVSALAAIALLVPATAQAAAPDKTTGHSVAQLGYSWGGN